MIMNWKQEFENLCYGGDITPDIAIPFIQTEIIEKLIEDIQGFNRVADSYQNTRQRVKYIESQLKSKWLI